MNQYLIEQVLRTAYVNGEFNLPTIYEGDDEQKLYEYEQTQEPFAQFVIVWNQPIAKSSHKNGLQEYAAFFQITLNYPQGEGYGNAAIKGDEICSYFLANGGRHFLGDQCVRVSSCGKTRTDTSGAKYKVYLTGYFSASTPRGLS